MDWIEACQILGVPESATEAEIKEQYIYKAQLLHPDKNQDKPENIRKKAEAELVLVNQAYAIVSNPGNNPFRVPPKLSIEPAGIRFKDIPIGERKSTTLTIRNVGGPYTSIWFDNQPATWLAVTGVKSTGSERLPLEMALECQGIGEPGNKYTCELPIKLENEKTHAIDLASVTIELTVVSRPVVKVNVEKEMPVPVKKPVVEVPQKTPESQPPAKSRMGFSFRAFLINLLAFAILGAVAFYFVNTLFAFSEIAIMVGSILYTAVAFGFSLNHGITVGSRAEMSKTRN
jgi:hypothetical protein